MGSIARSIRVLELLATATAPLSHRELSDAFDIPKSTLSGILAELRGLGYVTVDPSGGYSPGPSLISLGIRTAGSTAISRSIHPVLVDIASKSRETSLFAIRTGESAVFIDVVEGPEDIRYVPELGVHLPLHATAVGKVMLAWDRGADTALIRYERFTARTITDRSQLLGELEIVRAQGFATNFGESKAGVTGVAVPVIDDAGVLLGAISVAGPSDRVTEATAYATAIWSALRRAGYGSV